MGLASLTWYLKVGALLLFQRSQGPETSSHEVQDDYVVRITGQEPLCQEKGTIWLAARLDNLGKAAADLWSSVTVVKCCETALRLLKTELTGCQRRLCAESQLGSWLSRGRIFGHASDTSQETGL